MWQTLRAAIAILVMLTLLTGLGYPLLVTGIAQALFPRQAQGSLIERDGEILGSELIGQQFDRPEYFWGRPSATRNDTAPAYNGGASSGSNLGPTNPALVENIKSRVAALREADPGNTAPVPVDLVTSSASGLDPHISPAAAEFQVARVARARNLPVDAVREAVGRHTVGRTLGLLGEPRVNVLLLNLELDSLTSAPH